MSGLRRQGARLGFALAQRGEPERLHGSPLAISDNLVVQLGAATEELNRRWFERNTDQVVTDIQRRVRHPVLRWMAATLDGREHRGRVRGQVHAALGVLGRGGGRKAHAPAAAQYVADHAKLSVLSIITGGGKWVEIEIAADPLYQHLLLTAEKKFWRCVESGELPRLFGVEPPRPRIAAVRMVDMSASNAWAEFAAIFRETREAFVEHEKAKTELKGLMPEDAKEAFGHGVRAKRSKFGAISFELLELEAGYAPVQ